MPQLDFNYYLSQATYLFIIFTIFHIYMKSYILPFFYEYFYLSYFKLNISTSSKMIYFS